MTIAQWYLGVVTQSGSRGTLPVATIRPLLGAIDGAVWGTGFADAALRTREFPNRGCVSWLRPDDAAKPGTLWQFEVEEQSYNPDDHHHDSYKVAHESIRRVYEVLDLAQFGDEERAREALTIHGIRLPEDASEFCIRLEKRLWSVERFSRKSPGNSLWTIELDSDGMLRLTEWDATQEPTFFDVDRRRLLLPPNARPNGPQRLRDWSSDQMALKRVLNRFRKRGGGFPEALTLSERAVTQLSQTLCNGDSSTTDIDLELSRVRRVKRFLDSLRAEDKLASTVMAFASDSPIADEIERVKAQAVASEKAALLSRIEEECQHERATLSGIRREIEERRTELAGIERKIEEAKALQEQEVRGLEAHLEDRVRDAMSKPAELLGSVALIRAVAGIARYDPQPGRSRDASKIPQPASATELTTWKDVKASLMRLLLLRDIPPNLIRPLHASFLANAVPLVGGSRAYDLLNAYAECVTGRSLCWIPVSASWIDPADYLGRSNGANGFVSHPCGLLDFLEEAAGDDRMHLVVLDGVERAPVESYLLPLLACHADRYKSRPRGYPLASGGQNGIDAISENGRIRWPSNVLLAGTVASGSSGVPLPSELWNHATLILSDAVDGGVELEALDDLHPDRRSDGSDVTQPASYVSEAGWNSWRIETFDCEMSKCAELWSQVSAKRRLARSARDLALRFFAASGTLSDEFEAIGDTVAYCLLPHIADDGEYVRELLSTSKTAYADCERAVGALARLSRW